LSIGEQRYPDRAAALLNKRPEPAASRKLTLTPVAVIGWALSMGCVIQAPSSEPASISVTTSADGASVRQGSVVTIRWQAHNMPPEASVELAAQKTVTGRILNPIATSLPVRGSYDWKIPVFVPQPIACARDATGACVNDMNPNTTYRIIVTVSVPALPPSLPPVLATAMSEPFTMFEHVGP